MNCLRFCFAILSISIVLALFVGNDLFVSLAQSTSPPSNPSSTVNQPPLSDYHKEALAAIKDMTSNLLFLAVGVFALVGGYLSREATRFKGKGVLRISFLCFGISLGAGLALYMSLIDQLQSQSFDPNAFLIRWASIIQILSIAVGAVLFYLFLISNITDD